MINKSEKKGARRINFIPYLLLVQVFIICACDGVFKKGKQKLDPTNVSIREKIIVDGELEDWERNPFIVSLNAPWKQDRKDSTIFQYSNSKQWFYFYFETKDRTPLTVAYENELSIAEGDRVELFFSSTKDMSSDYYCLEMNPKAEVLDYRATYYRNFDEAWDFQTVEIASKHYEDGYIIEGKIAISELHEIGIDAQFYLGIFKADYQSKDIVTWYSWITPNSKEPDFHIPSALGSFEFFKLNI